MDKKSTSSGSGAFLSGNICIESTNDHNYGELSSTVTPAATIASLAVDDRVKNGYATTVLGNEISIVVISQKHHIYLGCD